MNSNDRIVENIVDHVYGKYDALTSTCMVRSPQPTISPASSSEEMWDELEKSQFKSILSSNIHA